MNSSLQELLLGLARERAADYTGTSNTLLEREAERQRFEKELEKQKREDDVAVSAFETGRFIPQSMRIKTVEARKQVRKLGEALVKTIDGENWADGARLSSDILKIAENSNITPLFRLQLITLASSGLRAIPREAVASGKTLKKNLNSLKRLMEAVRDENESSSEPQVSVVVAQPEPARARARAPAPAPAPVRASRSVRRMMKEAASAAASPGQASVISEVDLITSPASPVKKPGKRRNKRRGVRGPATPSPSPAKAAKSAKPAKPAQSSSILSSLFF